MTHPTLPFDDRPGLVRRDHQLTAKLAALDVLPRSGTQRRRVFDELWRAGPFGRTRDELATRLLMSQNTVRPRVKELIDGGLVEPSGQLRPSSMGHPAEVLVLTETGRARAP